MQLSDFSRLLDVSTADAIAFAKTILLDDLPVNVAYRVFPNQSHDDNRAPDVFVYPEDSLESIDDYIEMSRDECVRFLYRDGRVPEWIDISVGSADNKLTYIDCLCCGRFTDDDERLYYVRSDRGPFGIKSPTFPTSIPFGETRPRFWIADMPKRRGG